MNYEEQADATSKFYIDFDNIINETIVNEIYEYAVVGLADENNWNGDGWDEFEDEQEWYKYNKAELGYQAEEEAIEEIIRKVFEDVGVNVNRLNGDDYLEFEDHVKASYPFIDPQFDEEADED